jgi:hypothetical protein
MFSLLAKIPYVKNRITPSAWDQVFNGLEDSFILIHLKNGQLLGGAYSGKSFASANREKEDLYLSELWTVDANGVFSDRGEHSGGVWIKMEEVSYIEILGVDFMP